MPDNILFYAVFLSQTLLISFYFPRKMLKRISYVFATYPPSQYPRLYPEPIAYYEKAQRNYRNLNVAVLLVGLSLLAVFLGGSRSGEWDMSNFVFPYFIIQFFPVMLLEIRSFKYYRLMRKTDSRTTRKAELQPRRLFDFISPTMIGLAVLVYFAFIALILYIRQFDFPWFGGYWNIVGVTAGNIFFAAIVAWNMYGKKRDPYQAYEDRKRQIELVVQQMVFMSIAATTFMALEVILASLDLRDLQPTVMSLYFQLIAVVCLRTLRIDNINFAVYKGDPSEERTEIRNDAANAHNFASVGLWVGLGLGLLFGALILVEGGTVKGFVMGVGIGTILGLVVGSLLESRRSTSPTV